MRSARFPIDALRRPAVIVPIVMAFVFAAGVVGLVTGSGGPSRALPVEEEYSPGEPASDWMYAARGGAQLDPSDADAARAEAATLRQRTADVDPALAAAEWTWMGPKNIGGRVLDLVVDPENSGTLYAATAGGGVWKSTDTGVTFDPAWPADATQVVAALARTNDGTLLAGTGEPPPGGGSLTMQGDGLYRSTDGGSTWTHVGLEESGTISEIVVSGDTIWVASMGHGFAEGGQRGLYRSTDGGDSWELVLAPENPRTGATDVAVDPSDPDHLLVATWERIRLPDRRIYGGTGSRLWESHDGGDTWEVVEAVTAEVTGRPTGRIAVSFAPSDADRVYAEVINDLGFHDAFLRSDDGGATWQEMPGDSFLSGAASSYGWWFGRIWVDPDEPDKLFVGGVDLTFSTDGGESWLVQSNTLGGVVTGVATVNPHADQHAMAWDPTVPGRVYLGNDGGVYRSLADGLGDWVGGLEQGWTQHYSVGVSRQQPSRVVSGLQDNMCQRNYVAGDLGQPNTWSKYGLCGDGLQTLIHPEDDRLVYGCAQYGGNCSRADDGGGAFRLMSFPGQRSNWWVPIVFDPSDPSVMYAGTNVVSKSTEAGDPTSRSPSFGFQQISPDLTSAPEVQPDPQYDFGTITTLAVAPSDSGVIYVGTDDGRLWRTTTGGGLVDGEWERLDEEIGVPEDEKVLPPGPTWVTRVAVDPDDADTAYATYSGYRGATDEPHVVKTTDGGRTWTDVSSDLPNAPVNEIVLVDGGDTLAVGTDVGVFLSRDNGSTWLAAGSGLPNVPVFDLAIHTETDLLTGETTTSLTAATFGRGIMRLELPTG